jgi:hypothetical protein
MFKLLITLALAAGSATGVQANQASGDDRPSQTGTRLAPPMPRQAAGPVKIRLRTSDEAALRLVMIIPGANGELRYQRPATGTSID